MRIPVFNKIEQKVREKLRKNNIYSSAYDTDIYFPYYDRRVKFTPNKPNIYNNEGRKMDTWFIRDVQVSAEFTVVLMYQPTIFLENKSITTAKYTQPFAVLI